MDCHRLQLLQSMPIFGGVREETLEALLEGAAVVRVASGNYFFRENDNADSMFVLEQGEVEILKYCNGRQFQLRILKAGDCFGEMALIGLFPRSASVRAVGDCIATELSSASLYGLYETDVEQFAIIQMNVARELCRRLRATDEWAFQVRAGKTNAVPSPAGALWTI